MSSSTKTDFLRFNAYSIKELITRKLSQDSNFTDQIYEGSNLAVLIDIVSYMYQCLVYQLNNAASESMFQDTQLYENMVRLVKFLDYNPRGCTPSKMNLTLTSSLASDSTILPFSYIDTGLTDQNGRSICFSVLQNSQSLNMEQSTGSIDLTLHNGKWRMYDTIFTASGNAYETFVLNGLASYSEGKTYVANDYIYVYVYSKARNAFRKWEMDRDGLFLSSKRQNNAGDESYFTMFGHSRNAGSNDYVYSVTLNENHQYEIRFGDGNIGNLLEKDDLVYVFYLDTNGPDGKVDTDKVDIANVRMKCNEDIRKMPREFKDLIQIAEGQEERFEDEGSFQYTLNFNTQSQQIVTNFVPEESVEDIRSNAPNWFKTGYRLVSKRDYEYFIKNDKNITSELNGIGDIIDVKCMNNTEYVTKFYKWLYENGLKSEKHDGRYYFDGNFFTRTGYSYVDASDTNNIYLWTKTVNGISDSNIETFNRKLNNDILKNIKLMTTEVNILQPVTVNFDICAAPQEYTSQNYIRDDGAFDENIETTIEITLDDNQTYIGNNIQQSVYDIITSAFDQNYIMLGQVIDSVEMVNRIYQINGVARVRTVWNRAGSDYIKALDGISFASWTDTNVLDFHEDLVVGNSIRHIEDFQYPMFVGQSTLMSRIKVIKKQLTTVNSLKF